MPFIGQEPITGAFHKLDAITTSSTNTYNLLLNGGAYSPASANHLMVSLNGVIQSPGDSFTISGSQITFVPSSGTLSSSDSIDFIMAYGDVLNIGTPSDGTVSENKIAAGAVTGAKLASTISTNHTFSGANTFSGTNTFSGATTVPAATSAYQLLNTTTVSSSVTTLTFDNTIITSNHQIYKIQFESLRGGVGLGIQVSPDNGSTYRTSGYNGNRRRWYTSNSGSSYTEQGSYYPNHLFYSSNSAGDASTWEVTILNMLENDKTMCISYGGFGYADTYHTLGLYSSRYNTEEAHNNLRIFPADSGSFTSGKVSIFGIKTT